MRKKELCILIVVLIFFFNVIAFVLKSHFLDEILYNDGQFFIDCIDDEIIACNISYEFLNAINRLEYQIDYGSGLDLLKMDNTDGMEQKNSFFKVYYDKAIKKDNGPILYFKKNNYINHTNQYVAIRNIHITVGNYRYYLNDYYQKIGLSK